MSIYIEWSSVREFFIARVLFWICFARRVSLWTIVIPLEYTVLAPSKKRGMCLKLSIVALSILS